MKNLVFAAVSAVALAALSPAFAATGDAVTTVAKADVTLAQTSVAKGASTYVTVVAFGADNAQAGGLKPMASVSPSYAATVGAFVPCDTAEGREACAAAGNGMDGLAGAYVAKVTAKDVDGDATIGIYLPGKFVSATLKVGSAEAATPVSAEAAPKASEAKAGGGAKGFALAAAMAALAAAAVWLGAGAVSAAKKS